MAKGNPFSVHIKMLVEGLRVSINMFLYPPVPNWIQRFPHHLKTKEVCDKAGRIKPYSLNFIPNHVKTREICNQVIHIIPVSFLSSLTNLRRNSCGSDHWRRQLWDLIYPLGHFET